MGKKHKKHRERFKHQTTTQPKELNLKLSIPLTSLPKYAETSSSASKQSNESELSCKIQIQKAGLAFVIPKKKDTGQDIDTSLQGKKHKKKKHHHDNKPEPLHISKSHDTQSAYSDSSSQSAEKHSSPHCSASSSPLRKLSIVIPKLNSSSIPTSSPLLTYSPVQIPPVEVQADSDSEATKQDLSAVQTKQSSLAEITAKVPTTHHRVTSSEQCSTSVTNDTSEELQKLRTNIKYALKTIHYQLEKKDPQGIFAEPVTDEIAPGYSALISNPMDFSTMAKKIDTLQYQSVDEYKDDFLLMCNNCMTYNPEDTVFYQTAKKLSSSGLKLIAKETVKKADLLSVPTVAAAIGSYSRSSTPLSFQAPLSKRSISPVPSSSREHLSVAPTTRSQSNSNSLMCRIPLSVLNRHSIRHPLPTSGSMTQELRLSTLNHNSLVSSVTDGITSSLSSTAQWVADTMSAAAEPPYDDTGLTKLRVGWTSDNSDESSDEEEYDNVLEQVQAAAAAAVHEAAVNRKTVNLAYLDTSEAGRATLNILNPDGDDDVNVRNVDMTDLEALIAEGEEANKKLELEHSRHKTTPVAYLMYGPYGAFAPYFDSSFATLTRMDSSLLYSVYGDDMGVTYAHSLQRFVRGTSSFACEMAEAILNGLTSNKHRLLKEKLTEQRDKLFHMSQQQQQQQQQQPQQPVQQQQQQPQQETQQPEQEGRQQQQQPKQEEQQQQPEQGGQQQQQQQKQKEQEERKESQSDEKHSADQQITAGADMNEKDTMSTTTTVAITNITAVTNPVTTTTTTSATTGSVQQEKLAQPVLDKNVEILLQLQQLQNERLSRVPFTIPQSQEATTALHVAENLKQLTSKVTPGDVVSVQALQNAMGVTVTAANSVKSTVDSTTPYST